MIIPLSLLCFKKGENGTNQIDPEKFVDIVLSNIYRENFGKHISAEEDDYNLVYNDLLCSKLSEKTKSDIFTREALICTLRNIKWVVAYWQQKNSSPPIDASGSHGFMLCNRLLKYTA